MHRRLAFLLVSLAAAPALAQDPAAGPAAAAPPPADAPSAAATSAPATASTPVAALDCSALLSRTEPAPAALARLGAAQLEQLGAFQPGPLGELLIAEIAAEICANPEVQAALHSTCNPPAAPDVRELRARLIADSASAVASQADALARSAGVSPQSTEALLLTAVLQAVIETPSLRGLARQLLRGAPWTLRQDCSLSGQAVDAYHDLQVAAVLILALDAQLEKEAGRVSESDLQALALRALVATGRQAEGQTLSELQQASLRALVQDMLQARELEQKRLDAPGYATLTGVYANAAAHAVSLAKDAPVQPPARAVAIATAVASGDVEAALNQAAESVIGADGGTVVQALMFGMRVVRARSEEEAKGMLARAALGLGPWSDRWVVGLNVGVPSLDFDDFKVAGDAKLGYNGQSWGALAKGFLSYYDYTSNVLISDNFLGGGSGEFWVTFNSTGKVKGELRADLGASVYDTNSIPFGIPGSNLLSDETSAMYRGALLAGLRVESSSAAFGLWLGGGAQHEVYNQLTFDQNQETHIEDLNSTHAQLTGRLRAQFPLVRNILGGRLRADGLRHSITRESLALDIGDRIASMSEASSSVQVEVSARAFIDLEIAKFFGFVPAVEGGLDYFSLADEAGTVTNTVPILGVGIRRTEF